ncbi:hypothetical protein Acr_04g0010430 [Actinidia rufa]|uniref:Vacuolar ATPase assembly protein VMA22 n=1 Tax=Actinidia rufa TaxID=165716 RepID=A0A7J0EIK5_9ERIC|nr:hypothetical protein Acr_04g0010430 [Actinidia rufa]
MEEENRELNPENGSGFTKQHQEEEEEEDHKVVKFLDSADSYLDLFDSLSSALRQGWLELATARQSMGASRINSALFDLKYHNAATSLQVIQDDVKQPNFTLCKWVSTNNQNCSTEKAKFDEDELFEKNSTNAQLRCNNELQLTPLWNMYTHLPVEGVSIEGDVLEPTSL